MYWTCKYGICSGFESLNKHLYSITCSIACTCSNSFNWVLIPEYLHFPPQNYLHDGQDREEGIAEAETMSKSIHPYQQQTSIKQAQ